MGEAALLKVTTPAVPGGCSHYTFNAMSASSGVVVSLHFRQKPSRRAVSQVIQAGTSQSQGLCRGRLLVHTAF